MSWMKATDGTVSYVDLDKAQKFFAADNGDGTWVVYAQYSDYALHVLTGVTYTSQADCNAAIESHLGANLTTTF